MGPLCITHTSHTHASVLNAPEFSISPITELCLDLGVVVPNISTSCVAFLLNALISTSITFLSVLHNLSLQKDTGVPSSTATLLLLSPSLLNYKTHSSPLCQLLTLPTPLTLQLYIYKRHLLIFSQIG